MAVYPSGIECDEHLVQVPCVAGARAATTQGMSLGLAELTASRADSFVRCDHAVAEQQFFHSTVSETEAMIEPDTMADNLPKAVMFVKMDWF